MESSDSIALSLGHREGPENVERKTSRVRSEDDSAFCSTNGDNKSVVVDETDQQSLTSSTSPLTSTLVTNNSPLNQIIQNMRTSKADSPSAQSPTAQLEKRDSVGSTSSTGFQNRFASIMKQKLEQRSQQTNSFSQSIDISTADSSLDSDPFLDDQKGIPKRGRTKWMAAVVRKKITTFFLINSFIFIHLIVYL